MTAGFADLPTELHDEILSYLTDRGSLAVCSLLCRASRQSAQQHLFHSIVLSHASAHNIRGVLLPRGTTFLNLLRSSHSLIAKLPVQYIRNLTFTGGFRKPLPVILIGDITLVLSTLPSLRSLCLSHLKLNDTPAIMDLHGSPSSTFSLDQLTLNRLLFDSSSQMSQDEQSISRNTLVKLLNLFHTIAVLRVCPPDPSVSVVPEPRGFRGWDTLRNLFTPTRSSSFRHSPLEGPRPPPPVLSDSLRVGKLVYLQNSMFPGDIEGQDLLEQMSALHVEYLEYSGDVRRLDPFLQSAGSHLRQLGLTFWANNPTVWLAPCTRLTRLSLRPTGFIYTNGGPDDQISVLTPCLSDLPCTLSHLVIHINVHHMSSLHGFAREVAHCTELDQRLCALAVGRGLDVVCKVVTLPSDCTSLVESGLLSRAYAQGLVQFLTEKTIDF